MAQAISAPTAGEAVTSALPDVGVKVQSLAYTAFGEQMGNVKVSGFGYNAEAYAAATGMLNLRARQYEPAMNRFSQKDIVRGQAASPLSLNRYGYCVNDPLNLVDPSGKAPTIMYAAMGGIAVSASRSTTIRSKVKSAATIAKNSLANLQKAAAGGYSAAKNSADASVRRAYRITTEQLKSLAKNSKRRPTVHEQNLLFAATCALESKKVAKVYTTALLKEHDVKPEEMTFLTSGMFDESIHIEQRIAVLDRLKKSSGKLTLDDLLNVGIYTQDDLPKTWWQKFLATIDLGGGVYHYADLLAQEYSLMHNGTSFWEMEMMYQQQKNLERLALLNYVGLRGIYGSIAQYNAAGSAIRGDGATLAAPGYESVRSDYLPLNLGNYGAKRYNPVEMGPLPKEIAETFTGASYSEVTLTKDTVLYRVYGGDAGKVGRYLTDIPQNGGMQSQLDLALNPDWGNTAQYVTRVIVPEGTTIYVGTAASQTINAGAGVLPGGGNQIFIPEVDALWFVN